MTDLLFSINIEVSNTCSPNISTNEPTMSDSISPIVVIFVYECTMNVLYIMQWNICDGEFSAEMHICLKIINQYSADASVLQMRLQCFESIYIVSVRNICKSMYSHMSENQLSILGGYKCSANVATTFRTHIYINKNQKQRIRNNSSILWWCKCSANDINLFWSNWTSVWKSFVNLRRMQVLCKWV